MSLWYNLAFLACSWGNFSCGGLRLERRSSGYFDADKGKGCYAQGHTGCHQYVRYGFEISTHRHANAWLLVAEASK
jgi:hypothetical protein